MGRKLTHEYVEQYFKEQGCELISQYENNRTKIEYKCSCGNISLIKYHDFQCGKRCGCGNKKFGEKRRRKFQDVKEIFEKGGKTAS